MTGSNEPVRIKFSDVCLTLEGKEILRNISLDLSEKRIGLLGRNGSGKTSFARLLSGLIAPSQGVVSLNETNPARDRRDALTMVGILFQNPDHQIIFPTVIEEIAFGLRQLGHRDADALAAEVLEKFGKAHWRDAYVYNLSQGQKHLVCLLSLLAMNPRLLVLDEPFAGLDIPTKRQLTRYLDRYQGSLVHVTHDPDDVAEYDHVLWIDKGALRAHGAPGDVVPQFLTEMDTLGDGDDISDLSR